MYGAYTIFKTNTRVEMYGHVCEFPCCVINSLSDAYMCQQTKPSLVKIMACRLIGAKPLSEPILTYCYLDHEKQTNYNRNPHLFIKKYIWKSRLENVGHFVAVSASEMRWRNEPFPGRRNQVCFKKLTMHHIKKSWFHTTLTCMPLMRWI